MLPFIAETPASSKLLLLAPLIFIRALTRRPSCTAKAGRRSLQRTKANEHLLHGMIRFFQRHCLREVAVTRGVSWKQVEVEQS